MALKKKSVSAVLYPRTTRWRTESLPLYKVCLLFSWRVTLAVLDVTCGIILGHKNVWVKCFSQFIVFCLDVLLSLLTVSWKICATDAEFWHGWWKRPGSSSGLAVSWLWWFWSWTWYPQNRWAGQDSVILLILQRTKYFEFWSGVAARIGDSILLELGQGEGASVDLWIYWVLTLFWMLSIHCLVREFLFPCLFKEFEAPRSYEDPWPHSW